MKGEKNFTRGIEISNDLQKKYKKYTKSKVAAQHAKYIALIRNAAYNGHIEAQFELGLNYEDQNYFIPDPMFNIPKRFYWYSKASKAGHPEATNNLASLYERGEGTPKNLKKALHLYKKAYKLGCSYAKGNYELLLKQHPQLKKL